MFDSPACSWHLAAALTRTGGVSPMQRAAAATSQSCDCSSSQGSSSAYAPSARRGCEAASDRGRWAAGRR